MHLEDIRTFALSFEGVEETTPFGPDVIVYKVGGKVFLLLPLDSELTQFNVKCDPELAIQYRETYPETVLPGYHMNKKHWNTVVVNGTLKNEFLKDQIRNSYELVRSKKKK